MVQGLWDRQEKRRIIHLLHILEEYPDQKSTKMWERVIKAIIESAYRNPGLFFNPPETFSKILPGSTKIPFGIWANVRSKVFAKKISFIGFVGNTKTGRYAILSDFLIDSDRQNPVFIYTFEISLKSNHPLYKVMGIFQDSTQADETKSYQGILHPDLVYRGDMAMGLARFFHELIIYPMPPQVAKTLGIIEYPNGNPYRC